MLITDIKTIFVVVFDDNDPINNVSQNITIVFLLVKIAHQKK